MNQVKLLDRVNHLLQKGEEALTTEKFIELKGHVIDAGMHMGFRTASLSFIRMLYGEHHIYYSDFNNKTSTNRSINLKVGINIVQSIRDELENGWLFSIKEIVSAEIFSDFLEMSKYLLDEKYKDPAAVMIGSVLEEHLRLLCENNSVPVTFINKKEEEIPKKADLINSDLVKANVYGILEQKNITAWLDLRNRAAHGRYEDYTLEQVNLMYYGVLNFITKA